MLVVFLRTLVVNPFLIVALVLLLAFFAFARAGARRAARTAGLLAVLIALPAAVWDTVAVLRIASYFRVESHEFHHGLLPDVRVETTWGPLSYTLITNSAAMIDRQRRPVPPVPDGRRFLFVGDSFTEGVGFDYDSTFVGLVDRELRARGCDVLNAAVVSMSPKLHYFRVRDLIESGFEFDELYVFVDISDVQDEIAYDSWEPDRVSASFPRRAARRLRSVFYKSSAVFRTASDLLSDRGVHAGYWRDRYYDVRARWTFDPNEYERWGREGLQKAAQNTDRLYELARAHDIPMTIAVYPWPAQIYRQETGSIQKRFWSEFCADRSIEFLDLFPHFVGRGPAEDVIRSYFIEGDVHWNAQGHRLVAAAVLEKIGLDALDCTR